jgi:transcriptional regulator with XRE-family HTH domain
MESKPKSDFAKMCRTLRVQKGLKQREVAEGIGVKPSTYGNIESSPWKVVGIEKVERMIQLYGLGPPRSDELRDAWSRVPLSAYGEKQRQTWERRNRQRSKAKHHDRLKRSLCEVLGLLLPEYPHTVCACSFDREEPCEVCMAFENLGLPPFKDMPTAIRDLAKLQDKLVTSASTEVS